MKKTIIIIIVLILISACKASPKIDVSKIPTEPTFYEFTEEETRFFNDYFKSVTQKYNLNLIDKDHFEIYMGDTIAKREKFYEFKFLDQYKTEIKVHLDSNKEGCSVRIDIPYEQKKFYSENQLNLFLDLYSLTFNASDESKKHFSDSLVNNYNNGLLWDQKTEYFDDFYLENFIFPFEGSGLFNLLSFGRTDKICI